MPSRYRIAEGVLDRRIAGDLLVHTFESDDVFVLNGDARIVFEAIKQFCSKDEVCDLVASRVFCDAVELRAAVERTIEKMLAAGMIVQVAEASPGPAHAGLAPG
jgi:hypothetical protein